MGNYSTSYFLSGGTDDFHDKDAAILEGEHKDHHDHVEFLVSELVRLNRVRIGIEPYWSIMPVVVCHPEGNASISWKMDTFQAWIQVDCHLPYQLLRWETIHELWELRLHRTGHVFRRVFELLLPGELNTTMNEDYEVARNQEIECLVRDYLQHDRPSLFSSSRSFSPSSSLPFETSPGILDYVPPSGEPTLNMKKDDGMGGRI